MKQTVFILLISVLALSCAAAANLHPRFNIAAKELEAIANLQESPTREALLADGRGFLDLTDRMLQEDSRRLAIVDKKRRLSAADRPQDLVNLDDFAWASVSRKGWQLRREAAEAARLMSAEAKEAGVTLLISSCYRSYERQEAVYRGWVERLGQAEADRISAPPGASQHQLGDVIDFGSIDDSFTETKAELWLRENAGRFGYSLSFPQGYEKETGYKHESWHYRYIGQAACLMQEAFFDGLQFKMLEFWQENRDFFAARRR